MIVFLGILYTTKFVVQNVKLQCSIRLPISSAYYQSKKYFLLYKRLKMFKRPAEFLLDDIRLSDICREHCTTSLPMQWLIYTELYKGICAHQY